mmetsp:Transcript_15174/g.47697  ORF Transcript_15174/g.47697 Transcript_15174/m.47697 type:complete len:444 (+) Transcript_15174:70-1401(+)
MVAPPGLMVLCPAMFLLATLPGTVSLQGNDECPASECEGLAREAGSLLQDGPSRKAAFVSVTEEPSETHTPPAAGGTGAAPATRAAAREPPETHTPLAASGHAAVVLREVSTHGSSGGLQRGATARGTASRAAAAARKAVATHGSPAGPPPAAPPRAAAREAGPDATAGASPALLAVAAAEGRTLAEAIHRFPAVILPMGAALLLVVAMCVAVPCCFHLATQSVGDQPAARPALEGQQWPHSDKREGGKLEPPGSADLAPPEMNSQLRAHPLCPSLVVPDGCECMVFLPQFQPGFFADGRRMAVCDLNQEPVVWVVSAANTGSGKGSCLELVDMKGAVLAHCQDDGCRSELGFYSTSGLFATFRLTNTGSCKIAGTEWNLHVVGRPLPDGSSGFVLEDSNGLLMATCEPPPEGLGDRRVRVDEHVDLGLVVLCFLCRDLVEFS